MSKLIFNLKSPSSDLSHTQEKPVQEQQEFVGDIRVDAFHVRTDIKSRFATTVITSRMTNVTNEAKEVSFTSKLPEAAFITDFCMQIDDKIIHGEVKEKQAAKQTYDDARSRGKTAGHVFQKTRETDIFTTSTNVGAKTEVIFTLTYQEILKRVHGVYKHVINLDLDQVQPTSDVQIEVQIIERGRITKLHVPKFGPKMGEKTNAELLKFEADPDCSSKSTIDQSVSVSDLFYRISSQELSRLEKLGAQFVILYDVERDSSGGQVQVVNGYFVHFCAPEGDQLPVGGKHVIFVLDNSGSMQGRKLQQTKDAMRRVLGDLRKEDTFNIIWFSNTSHLWKPKSLRATQDNKLRAISDVEKISTEGCTNIHDAMIDGLKLLTQSESHPLASMLVFMTDGQANVGISTPRELVQAISDYNKDKKFIIHTMAFGNDADYDMLQQISARNDGLACKIYEDLDADVQLIGFYQQISSPLLADVKITYQQGSVDLDSLVYDHTSTYYQGSEMMILGRLSDLRLNTTTDKATDNELSLEAEINGRSSKGGMRLVSRCCRPWPTPVFVPPASTADKRLTTKADKTAGEFIERMWAYQTIKKLLKEAQLTYLSDQEKDAKKKEALKLSLKYRFVTELTSMVVVEGDLKKMDDAEKFVERDDAFGGFTVMGMAQGSQNSRAMPTFGGFNKKLSGRGAHVISSCSTMGAATSPGGGRILKIVTEMGSQAVSGISPHIAAKTQTANRKQDLERKKASLAKIRDEKKRNESEIRQVLGGSSASQEKELLDSDLKKAEEVEKMLAELGISPHWNLAGPSEEANSLAGLFGAAPTLQQNANALSFQSLSSTSSAAFGAANYYCMPQQTVATATSAFSASPFQGFGTSAGLFGAAPMPQQSSNTFSFESMRHRRSVKLSPPPSSTSTGFGIAGQPPPPPPPMFCFGSSSPIMQQQDSNLADDDADGTNNKMRDSSRSRSRSASPIRKPISFVIVIIEQSNKSINDQSIIQIIHDWKRILGQFFLNMKTSKPKQPFVIRLIAVNAENGKVSEIDKIDNSVIDFAASLEKAIDQGFPKVINDDQIGDYRSIEDLVKRQEDVEGKKQIWVNPDDLDVSTGPVSDVFYYLNKIVGYDYVSQDELQ